jgi:hypothetical protein
MPVPISRHPNATTTTIGRLAAVKAVKAQMQAQAHIAGRIIVAGRIDGRADVTVA